MILLRVAPQYLAPFRDHETLGGRLVRLLLHHAVSTVACEHAARKGRDTTHANGLALLFWCNGRREPAGSLGDRFLDTCEQVKLLEKCVQLLDADGAQGLFAAAQHHLHADLIPCFQELFREGLSHGPIMCAHLKRDANAFYLDALLPFPALALALVLLVLVFAVVEEAAHRRGSGGVHLDEVEAFHARLPQGFLEGNDPDLPAVRANKAHLPRTDALVYAKPTASARDRAEGTTTRNGG